MPALLMRTAFARQRHVQQYCQPDHTPTIQLPVSFLDHRNYCVHTMVACHIQYHRFKCATGFRSRQLLYSVRCRAVRPSRDEDRAGRILSGKHLSYAEPNTPVSASH